MGTEWIIFRSLQGAHSVSFVRPRIPLFNLLLKYLGFSESFSYKDT